MSWQPIETAPLDGTVVIVYDGDIKTGRYSGFIAKRWHDNSEAELPIEPTHWMPSPDPPS